MHTPVWAKQHAFFQICYELRDLRAENAMHHSIPYVSLHNFNILHWVSLSVHVLRVTTIHMRMRLISPDCIDQKKWSEQDSNLQPRELPIISSVNVLISYADHEDQRKWYEMHSVHNLFNNWNSELNRNDIDVKELESCLMHSRKNRHALYQFELSDHSTRSSPNWYPLGFALISHSIQISIAKQHQIDHDRLLCAGQTVVGHETSGSFSELANFLRLAFNHGTHKESILGIAL